MKKDVIEKNVNKIEKNEQRYSYYSRVLKEPFDSVENLVEAEEAYYAKLKAKEDKAAEKKADAQKVEEAFKALNAARKAYKETSIKMAEQYSKDLKMLKEAYASDVKELKGILAEAEELYAAELKAFTAKYPEGYHLTLKDGDFETTISSACSKSADVRDYTVADLFKMLFDF